MNKVTGVFANSGEDFTDELASSIVYKYASEIFGPTVNKLNESDDPVDNALAGALTTLRFGIQSMVLIYIVEMVINKTALVAGAIYAFLKSTNMAKKAKEIVAGAVSGIPLVGNGMGKAIHATTGFITKDRELIAKSAIDVNSNVTSNMTYERQNQILIKKAQYDKEDRTLKNAVDIRNKSRDNKLAVFTHKTQTGTWKKTTQDKLIYQQATGQDLKEIGVTWNQVYVDKLNSYNQFAKDVEGKILSLSQVQLDYLVTLGSQRVD